MGEEPPGVSGSLPVYRSVSSRLLNVALIGSREQIRMPQITGAAGISIKQIIHGVAIELIIHQRVRRVAVLHHKAVILRADGVGENLEDEVTAAGVSESRARRSGGPAGRAADVYAGNSAPRTVARTFRLTPAARTCMLAATLGGTSRTTSP